MMTDESADIPSAPSARSVRATVAVVVLFLAGVWGMALSLVHLGPGQVILVAVLLSAGAIIGGIGSHFLPD